MRVIVDFPVRAKGRPKGHSGGKIIIGYLSDEFDLEVNDEPMAKAIEIKSQYGSIDYLQNGDGHFYRQMNLRRTPAGDIADGHHFPALYNNDGNPFIAALMRDIRNEFRNRSEAEVNKDYYPKQLCERNRYSHDRLINLETAVIENLEFRNEELAKATTRQSIAQYLVSQGALYQRVPEPSYAVSLIGKNVSIKQFTSANQEEFERDLSNDYTTLAFFNVSDLERVREFASELAEEVGGVYGGGESFSYAIEHYSPLSSYADELTLYRLGKQIQNSVVDNMKRGTNPATIAKLLEWNNQTLSMLRDLSTLLSKRDWMSESPALERVIGNCLDHDREHRTQTFTKPVVNSDGLKFDFELAYSQWQMREFNAPSMRR